MHVDISPNSKIPIENVFTSSIVSYSTRSNHRVFCKMDLTDTFNSVVNEYSPSSLDARKVSPSPFLLKAAETVFFQNFLLILKFLAYSRTIK
jgi:hypothetical protein